jgi:pyruvate/2-oxoglutarate dehydrogenase complex dihydrolipoamide dehydrogenase (E3) component
VRRRSLADASAKKIRADYLLVATGRGRDCGVDAEGVGLEMQKGLHQGRQGVNRTFRISAVGE